MSKSDIVELTSSQEGTINVGLTVLRVKVGNPAKPKVTTELEFLVDSGAVYSVVPSRVLRKLGIKPLATEEFRLADGSSITRKKGIALFKYQNKVGGADVIFGEEGGSLMAVDAANGKPLWSFATNQIWKASPMTYMFDGKQYIAAASGSNIIAFGMPD